MRSNYLALMRSALDLARVAREREKDTARRVIATICGRPRQVQAEWDRLAREEKKPS